MKIFRTEWVLQNNEMTPRASVLTIFICILFGANTVAIKFCLTGLGPFTAAGLRFFIAAAVIFCWAKITHVPLRLSRRQIRQVCILAAIFVCQLSCFYQGVARTTASHGILIANVLPFFVLILAHFFIPGDRITLKKGVGITLGFIGVFFLLLDDQNLSGDLKSGDFIVLFSVALWSASAVFAKRIISGYDPVQITLFPMAIGTPFFFIAAFFWDEQMVIVMNDTVIKALLYQALVSASFGFIAWNSLLQRFGATSLHSFVFIMPMAGVLFSVQLLGEAVTPYLTLSIALIVSGVVVVNLKRKKKTGVNNITT